MAFVDYSVEQSDTKRPPRLEEGVHVFDDVSVIEDQDTRRKLQSMLAIAREKGWRDALAAVIGPETDYVTSESRLGFLASLPLRADQYLLEIGVSLGQVAIPLARRVRAVDGLEVVPDQAKFAAERARQEGVENLRLAAGGADCRLPYPPATFDGVVLNLVLEWCANRSTEDHEAVQQRLLGEMHRVLKPGGFLFLTTKNRFALRLLLGGKDEHVHEARWGNALPRWLGRRLAGGRRHGGRLHSYGHLKRMIGWAGFTRIEGFWAAPEMRSPKQLVPVESPDLSRIRRQPGFEQGDSRKTRLIMRLIPSRFVRHFTPGLTFLAFK